MSTISKVNTFSKRLMQLMSPNNALIDAKLKRGVIPDKEREEKRNTKGLSYQDVGSMCGVSYQAVSNWLASDTVSPKTSTLNKLAEAFGVSVPWLLAQSDIPQENVVGTAAVYKELGISENMYSSLVELKNAGVDMKKFMSGINALFEYCEYYELDNESDSIDSAQKEYTVINALNTYLTNLYVNGTPFSYNPHFVDDMKSDSTVSADEIKRNSFRLPAPLIERYNYEKLEEELKNVRAQIVEDAYEELTEWQTTEFEPNPDEPISIEEYHAMKNPQEEALTQLLIDKHFN